MGGSRVWRAGAVSIAGESRATAAGSYGVDIGLPGHRPVAPDEPGGCGRGAAHVSSTALSLPPRYQQSPTGIVERARRSARMPQGSSPTSVPVNETTASTRLMGEVSIGREAAGMLRKG